MVSSAHKKTTASAVVFLCQMRRETVFPKGRGFRRLRRPGSIVPALRAKRWVPPTERAGSEGSIVCRLRRQRCLWQRKPSQPGWRPLEMHPFWCCAPPFPRRGNFTCRSTFTLISSSKYSAAKISPSGGDVAAGDRRGAFPRAAGAVVWFCREAAYKLHRPQGDTTTL